jgi:hypothetical protein
MPAASTNPAPSSWSGLLRAYGRELRGWLGGIGIRYAIAIVLFLSGGASLIAAIGVAIVALFHWLEAHYGTNQAYAVVIALLVVLALVSALAAMLLLRRPLPSLPRPGRHAGWVMGRSAMLAVAAPPKMLVRMDAVTEVMVGLAAACLIGWLVSSRRASSRTRERPR